MPNGSLYMSWQETAEEYRRRWLANLDREEATERSLRTWKEAACSAIVIAIALVAVIIMEEYTKCGGH